jgi:hypothetical protein
MESGGFILEYEIVTGYLKALAIKICFSAAFDSAVKLLIRGAINHSPIKNNFLIRLIFTV